MYSLWAWFHYQLSILLLCLCSMNYPNLQNNLVVPAGKLPVDLRPICFYCCQKCLHSIIILKLNLFIIKWKKEVMGAYLGHPPISNTCTHLMLILEIYVQSRSTNKYTCCYKYNKIWILMCTCLGGLNCEFNCMQERECVWGWLKQRHSLAAGNGAR